MMKAEPVIYHYRYCDRCRCEWPAKHANCPNCVLWLGDRPLERLEWQLTPAPRRVLQQGLYEVIAASALVLRVLGPRPDPIQLTQAGALLTELLNHGAAGRVLPVHPHGWLTWHADDARRAFLDALKCRDALIERLRDIELCFTPGSRLRWGLIGDLFLLPCSERARVPCLTASTAAAIFGFEPDNALLVSAAMYQRNRQWEHFVGVPARRRNDSDWIAYAPLGHKQPSALDHIRVTDRSTFADRTTELSCLDEAWQASPTKTMSIAVIGPPGAGKTRLIREWVRLHPDLQTGCACFSIFGGDLADFVGQLAALAEGDATLEALLDTSIKEIESNGIQIIVLDDLHWADHSAWCFLRQFLQRMPTRGVLIILGTRPAAQTEVAALSPHAVMQLDVLPEFDLRTLAERLSPSPRVAARATALARGNPLFVEQFTTWATESGYTGDGPCPGSLHDVVMARIRLLENGRLQGLRQQIAWTPDWMRPDLDAEFAAVEVEIGLWLDRLETGDYGDAVGLLDYLELLRRVEFELFMAANLSGRPRSRSTRLRESIDRLVMGSADALLDNLQGRAARLQECEDLRLAQQAEWIAECAREARRWRLAQACLAIASAAAAPWQQASLRERAEALDRLLGDDEKNDDLERQTGIVEELERRPAVDPTNLAETWYQLGRRCTCAAYYTRALLAAESIGATGWACRARAALSTMTPD